MSMGEVTNPTSSPLSATGGVKGAGSAGGGSVDCPGCQAAVSKTAKFCGHCGTRQWEPCLECGEPNSVSERFCGGCGADLAGKLAEARSEATQVLEESARMAEVGNLVAAVQRLEAVALPAHSQLATLRASVAERIEQYRRHREQVVAQAGEVMGRVKQAMAEVRFGEALAEAERIPPALRNAELAELHERLLAKVKLAGRLREQLTSGVAEKKYEGLLIVARQLAELEPHDSAVQKLLAKLETWQANFDTRRGRELVGLAVQALGENAYRKAATLLAKVPQHSDAELEKQYRTAKETVWLANQLATAPYASAHTVAAVGRLLERQPADPGAKKIAAQLSERWKVTLAQVSGVPATWAKAPADCALARVVELCPLPQHLVAACKGRKLDAHEWLVAYGLALQSGGMAAIRTNLLPAAKSSCATS